MIAADTLMGLVVTALSAAPAIADGGVVRQTTRPMPEGKLQRVAVRVVRSGGQQVLFGGAAPIDWQTVIGIECACRATAGQSADAALAPLLQAVHVRLAGSDAMRAAGFELDPGVEIVWDQEDAADRIGSATFFYTVRHRSPFASLAVQA